MRMPIQLEIFHPDRIVVGIGRGEVTLEEYQNFMAELVKAGVLHYRKIIDAMSATTPDLSIERFVALEARLATSLQANRLPRGPLAIVINRERVEIARIFKKMASNDRPVEVFSSIHDARRWLREQPVGSG
jgi:hypothetical protein